MPISLVDFAVGRIPPEFCLHLFRRIREDLSSFFSDRGTSFSVEAVDGHLGSQWRRVDLDFHFAILRRN